jgi:Na+/pantothenate symporter
MVIRFFSVNSNIAGYGNAFTYGNQNIWLAGLQTLIALHLLGVRGVIQLLRGGQIILRLEKPAPSSEAINTK